MRILRRLMPFLRETCLYCGHALERWKHWAMCPRCEPEWFPLIPPPKPSSTLQDKGVPGWGTR